MGLKQTRCSGDTLALCVQVLPPRQKLSPLEAQSHVSRFCQIRALAEEDPHRAALSCGAHLEELIRVIHRGILGGDKGFRPRGGCILLSRVGDLRLHKFMTPALQDRIEQRYVSWRALTSPCWRLRADADAAADFLGILQGILRDYFHLTATDLSRLFSPPPLRLAAAIRNPAKAALGPWEVNMASGPFFKPHL